MQSALEMDVGGLAGCPMHEYWAGILASRSDSHAFSQTLPVSFSCLVAAIELAVRDEKIYEAQVEYDRANDYRDNGSEGALQAIRSLIADMRALPDAA